MTAPMTAHEMVLGRFGRLTGTGLCHHSDAGRVCLAPRQAPVHTWPAHTLDPSDDGYCRICGRVDDDPAHTAFPEPAGQ